MPRGRTNGTLLVDLERDRPLDLWPNRTADTRAGWLWAHPGVTLLNRNRATEYARGVTLGAPAAQHVLERRLDRVPHRLAAALPASQRAPALTISMDARALPLHH